MAGTRAGALLAASGSGERATGRQAWLLLWRSSRLLSALVIAWQLATAVFPTLVVIVLGIVVGSVPGAVGRDRVRRVGRRP